MSTTLKTTTLALVTTFSLAACGWTFEPIDSDSTNNPTNNSGMDSGDPTEGDAFPMHFTCYNDTNYQVNAAGNPVHFDLMHTCVSLDGPDWTTEANMTKIYDACSATCQKTAGGWSNHCENEGWKSVEPTGIDCDPEEYAPEYGDDVLWLDGVRSNQRQVTCDLRTTCGDRFGATVVDRLQGDAIVSDESSPSGAQQQADLQLRIETGSGSLLDVSGAIDYTISPCGEMACPFYLGDLELLQTTEDRRMVLDMGALGRVDKKISNLQIRLAKPVLGLALKDGQVAFPAETLTFRVDVEVAGAAHPLLENGVQSFWVRNPIPVLGRMDGDFLGLDMEVPVGLGSLRFTTRPSTK